MAAMNGAQIFIVGAKRTPFGAFGGSLKNFTAAQLGGIAAKAALADLPNGGKDIVNHTIFGSVMQSDNSGAYLARHVGHYAGLPVHVPALTVNRLCGSGFQTVVNACQEIALGESNVVLTGGTENMSMAPYTLHGVRWGNTRYGVNLVQEDSLAAALVDQVPEKTPMGITAENLAEQYGITREDCDKFALESQKRWAKAHESGVFHDEIVPVQVPGKKGAVTECKVDEHPRASATLESLAKLPAVFKKGGTVSAGNASGICDGAAANVVASEAAVKEHGLKPLARIVGYHVVGVEPRIMGIGPVGAIQGLLERTGRKMEDIDLFDINEAFAAQWLAVQKELGLPMEKSNVNGGATALGHPLAASGARILNNLVYTLHKRNLKTAIGSACIGGGQGIAVMIERV